MLHSLFSKIWEKEEVPAQWKEGIVIKLPKKGDLRDCSNYRGIMLLSVPGKVLNRILLERMREAVDPMLRDQQAGFRRNRSCADQIASLRIIVEQSLEWNSPLYINFIDYEKAFDSLSESFEVKTGVRQGCLLSPFLFLLVIDWIMKTTTAGRKNGIQWTLWTQLDDLDFADDLALLSHSHSQMQDKTTCLEATSAGTGLKINRKKTELMKINTTANTPVTVGGEPIREVESFVYLGSVVDGQGGTDRDVTARIGKARAAMVMLKNVWASKVVSIRTKLRIFNSNVKSVLLYGCETWRTTKTMQQKIQTFLNTCLRRIFNIRWPEKIRNEELWERAGQEPVAKQILRRKWGWIGHTLRKPASSTTRQALTWNPQGKRKRGRPRNSWRRDTEAELWYGVVTHLKPLNKTKYLVGCSSERQQERLVLANKIGPVSVRGYLQDKPKVDVLMLQSLNVRLQALPHLDGYYYPPAVDIEKGRVMVATYVSTRLSYVDADPMTQVNPSTPGDCRLNLRSLTVSLSGGRELTLVNVYYPDGIPDGSACDWLKNLGTRTADARRTWVVAGDFNASHRLWDPDATTAGGMHLANAVLESNLSILNDCSVTRIGQGGQRNSAIDITLASPALCLEATWETGDDNMQSDHLPIHITLDQAVPTEVEVNSDPKYAYDKADWKKFRTLLEAECEHLNRNSPDQDIDSKYEEIRSMILTAANAAIPQSRPQPSGGGRLIGGWWNADAKKPQQRKGGSSERSKEI
nr:hypothetical protein BaRGS_016900 [Batillaria attramentaria]